MRDVTTIEIKKTTKEVLGLLKLEGESYDDVINRLLTRRVQKVAIAVIQEQLAKLDQIVDMASKGETFEAGMDPSECVNFGSCGRVQAYFSGQGTGCMGCRDFERDPQ